MPSFVVETVPVQISQSITDSALVQNLGPGTLYLGDNSAVSPYSAGAILTPGSSVNWPANSLLWVVSDTRASIGVLYGASGAGIGTVEANVTGPLQISDIVSPVLVQGGGEVLLQGNLTLPAGQFYTTPIPLGADGLRYPSLCLLIRAPGINDKLLYAVGVPGAITLAQGTVNRGIHGAFDSGFVVITLPWSISSGLELTFYNAGTNAITGLSYTLTGASTPVVDVESNLAVHFSDATGGGQSWPMGSGQEWNFPSTFTPYDLIFTTGPGGSCDGLAAAVMNNVGVYSTIDANLLANNGQTSLGENERFVYRSPGNGRALRITTGTVSNLTVSLSRSTAPPNFNRPSGLWVPYTPVPVAITVGNGTVVGRYTQIGKTVIAQGFFQLGTTSVVGTNGRFSLPVPASTELVTQNRSIGDVLAFPGDPGQRFPGTAEWTFATQAVLGVFTSGRMTATIPFTWGDGDQYSWNVCYEVD